MDRLLSSLLLLAEPLGLVWVGLLALTAGALWQRRWRRAGVAGGLALGLWICSGSDFPGWLLRGLEQPYVGLDLQTLPAADAMVLLGGGIEPSRWEGSGFHLTQAGDRVLMAVELLRLHKAPVLVLGGGGFQREGVAGSESALLAGWLTQTGLAGTTMLLPLPPCGNTHDEAVHVQEWAAARGWRRVLLITSANHLRRASATFATAGVPVQPVPCNFLTTLSTLPAEKRLFGFPSWHGLEKISVWMHETVGWYEYRRRGWIRAEAVPLAQK